ncbi:MAG: aminoacyl-tRNA hydrolase [Treponema sp.]|jgi:PTH1 family peptidyl-tRNA hydrolase|nr:aminoacyl-tRNA hydrolase [Treponema sp.]
MIDLVVFLGNHGGQYAHNRHNAGRILAERLSFFSFLNWQRKYKGCYAALEREALAAYTSSLDDPAERAVQTGRVHFLMPETFMNLSGDSVIAAASFFKIEPENIVLVHDELELPLGTAAFKFSGGLGGHNGLRSMRLNFGTADFWRLRIGIGRPNHSDIAGWVLSDFSAAEIPVLDRVLEVCAPALIRAILHGPEVMLPEWNKKKIVLQPSPPDS